MLKNLICCDSDGWVPWFSLSLAGERQQNHGQWLSSPQVLSDWTVPLLILRKKRVGFCWQDFPVTSDFCLGELPRIWKPRRLTKPYDFFGVGSYDIQLHHRNVIVWNPSFGYKETAGHIMFWSHISSMLVRFKLFVCGTSCHRRCFLLISAFHPIPPGVVVKNPRGQQAPQLADGKKNWSTNWESCPPQPVATLVTCVHHCNCNKCMYTVYIYIELYTCIPCCFCSILIYYMYT